jgi:RNA polymerase sigma factor (sigma-70 family)
MSTDELPPAEGALDRPSSGHQREETLPVDGLVRDHHPELRKHVYKRVRSWADAEDIVQQTYINLWQVPRLSAVENVRAYLYKIAGNLAQDWLRKRRVRESFAQEELLRALATARSAEEICESRDDFAELLKRIDDLPQQCRMALLLYRHEGLSLQEVAERLGIQPKSVHALIARAMKYLLETGPQEHGLRRGGRR